MLENFLLVLVLKKPAVTTMKNFHPDVLMSAVMKVCEREVLDKLNALVEDFIDPLQFDYRENRHCKCSLTHSE